MLRAELIRPLAELLRAHAELRGVKPAVHDSRRTVTYRELELRTRRVAGHLADLGVQPGDRVAILLGNCVESIEAPLAVNRAGAVAVPLDPTAGADELTRLLRDCGARMAVVDPPRRDLLLNALPDGHRLDLVLTGRTSIAGHRYEVLADTEPSRPARDDLGLDEPAWLLYTSGTTGRQKGVLSTQRGYLWSVAACAPAIGMTEDDRLLWPLPMHHTMGHAMCVVGTTALGAEVRLLDGLDPEAIIDQLRTGRYTMLAGVPTTYHRLLHTAGESGFRPAGLRAALVSGAASSHTLVSEFERAFGIPLLDSYGSTETCGAITTNWPGGPRAEGSCGLPLPGVNLRLVDREGHDVPEGAEGEIWVNGPNLMLGYHNDPAATAEVLRQGWYRTGDLARRGDLGHLQLTGRVKELIIRGGENIHPREVEEVVLRQPGVVDAAVAGRPHETLGEVPVAFVVPAPGLTDARGLVAACRTALSYAKVPVEFRVVSHLPRTPSGKVRRRLLLRMPARVLDAGRSAPSESVSSAAGKPDPAELRDRLATRTRRERTAELLTGVRRVLADLGYSEAGQPGIRARTFTELGVDSSTAVTLRDRLSAETGIHLPATVVFDHPTPESLARLLHQRLFGDMEVPAVAAGTPAPADDPIAIVSMACRFPGDIGSPEDLWRLVLDRREAVSESPADRGWAGTYRGAFLRDAAEFDAAFFGIGRNEATAMDPQQRMLLETAWEAAERGGIDPTSLHGTDTGVFVGVLSTDYAAGHDRIPPEFTGLLATGTAGSVASGRIAYSLGLRGPALTLDTACSSSLVAVHLAAQALRRGECALALAGGATVMATPAAFAEFGRLGGLSADGRCRAFSADADGVGWGEGAGLLLLERLSDARRLGHPVLATIRGSAVNQDGASNGLTAPSGSAQQQLIRRALADAGLDSGDVDVVETHGTGTPLGDPIEAQALLATYGQGRSPHSPLWIGSVKSNLGHTQAAAGVAGIIKTVMAMRHGVVPATLYAERRSPNVDWSAGAVDVITSAQEWPVGERPRRAGVSAFGISGTNAHIILEQPNEEPAPDRDTVSPAVVSWPISARSDAALRAQARRLSAALEAGAVADGEWDPADIAHSLAVGRAALPTRAVVYGRDRGALRAGVAALARGDDSPSLVRGTVVPGASAVLFTGEGDRRCGTGARLYRAYRVFAETLDEVCARLDQELAGYAPCPVREVVLMGSESGSPDRPVYAMSGDFAVQVALFRLFQSWGARPDFVVGHGGGEVAAAHAAGVFDLRDAARLVAATARLADAPQGGARAEVDRAAAFRTVTARPPGIPVLSTRTGEIVNGSDIGTVEHGTRPAPLNHTLRTLRRLGVRTLLTLGAAGAFGTDVSEEPDAEHLELVPALCHPGDEEESVAEALGRLFTRGVSVDRERCYSGAGARLVELPTYPFERRRFWLPRQEAAAPPPSTAVGAGAPRVAAPATLAGARALVEAEVARILGRPVEKPAAADRSFADDGIDSLGALELHDRLVSATGLDLPLETIFDHSTPERLARRLHDVFLGRQGLAADRPSASSSLLHGLSSRRRASLRLVCLPHAGGGTGLFREWPAHLPEAIELNVVRYPGREESHAEQPITDLHCLADLVTDAVLSADDRPVALFGHSMGAALAREVALRCQRLGRPVAGLLLSGCSPSVHSGPGLLHLAPDDELLAALRRLGGIPVEVLENQEALTMTLRSARADLQAIETYRPEGTEQLDCPVMAYGGHQDPTVPLADLLGWRAITTGSFAVRGFPGGHFYLAQHRRDVVADIAARLMAGPHPA
ncbi:type I polyketide synthase [Streptomyces sp. AA0539]|uniref:type I polyketide synthase n=1 Tax=Streptomyces sp. AA0539 TaxID=1210045 RepID=UPI001ED9BDAD|nr:type I polyketide synthase [Streptomyces sp. AA0539]